MNLIEINKENETVDARELHAKLVVKTPFHKWVIRRFEEYSFIEGLDFWTSLSKNGRRGRPKINYTLTLNTAKEFCLLENNGAGKEFRRYFIQFEQEAKSVIQMLRAENKKLKLTKAKRKKLRDLIHVQTGWQMDLEGSRWPIYDVIPRDEATDGQLEVWRQKHRIRISKGITDKIYNTAESDKLTLVPTTNLLEGK
jgi:phage anti-repressor protein